MLKKNLLALASVTALAAMASPACGGSSDSLTFGDAGPVDAAAPVPDGSGGAAGTGGSGGGAGAGGSGGAAGAGGSGGGGGACVPAADPCGGKDCGKVVDSCGDSVDCGSCQGTATCGGGGVPGVCGCQVDQAGSCGGKCGPHKDNCGNPIDCGSCACVPDNSAACQGKCGTQVNNCGQAVACTPCPCTPNNGAACAGANCGDAVNNCGQTVRCGTCGSSSICGGGGTRRVCGCPDQATLVDVMTDIETCTDPKGAITLRNHAYFVSGPAPTPPACPPSSKPSSVTESAGFKIQSVQTPGTTPLFRCQAAGGGGRTFLTIDPNCAGRGFGRPVTLGYVFPPAEAACGGRALTQYENASYVDLAYGESPPTFPGYAANPATPIARSF